MKYIAYLKQNAGCDYTIGCGILLVELKAQTWNEAIKELHHNCVFADPNEYLDWGPYIGDNILKKVTLYEVSREQDVPIERWYQELEEAGKIAEEMEQEKQEQAQFAKLKAKYDKS